MADFRFLHAADIHLDSPLHGLARYEGVPVDEVRGATRAAFDGMVALALKESVDFVVIAGDLFDGDWKDMGTGLYFAHAMRKLAAEAIPVYVLAGNHDAASVLTGKLPWPETVKVFSSRKPQTFTLPGLGVVLHGQSFPTQHVHDDLAAHYPPPERGVFNIGVLHTALDGVEGHAPYAPCSTASLQAKGYDYWALGHVHAFQRVCDTPPIIFPGNLQGRNIRETGAKGAVLVEVRDRVVTTIKRAPVDVVRWARVSADCTGASTPAAVHAAVRSALASAYERESEGRPLVARLELTGETLLAGSLRDGASNLRDEVRALAAAVAPNLWLEKVVLNLRFPAARPGSAEVVADEFLALLAEAADDPNLAALLEDDLKPFINARPTAAEDAGDDLCAAASRKDWSMVLQAAVTALPSRLSAGEG